MPRRKKTIKPSVKKADIISLRAASHKKNMRFNLSLVILIGMLTFSFLLLLLTLNRSDTVNAETKIYSNRHATAKSDISKQESRVLDDNSLNFKLTMPAQLGEWLYKIGEVQSLTDSSLSDQYLRIYVPLPEVKSSNFDAQNQDILTIKKFSSDEWDDVVKSCEKEKKDICDAAGTELKKAEDSKGESWVYAYTESTNCPQSIKDKCALAEKIIQSFQLK